MVRLEDGDSQGTRPGDCLVSCGDRLCNASEPSHDRLGALKHVAKFTQSRLNHTGAHNHTLAKTSEPLCQIDLTDAADAVNQTGPSSQKVQLNMTLLHSLLM